MKTFYYERNRMELCAFKSAKKIFYHMYVDHPNGQLTNRRGTFCPLMQYTKFSKKLEDVVTFSRVGHVYYPEKFEHVVQALHNG